ncbi:MAG: hypothetical protein V4732_15265 [Pseudomonadota bacterium]
MTIYLFSLLPQGFKELDIKPSESYAEHNCLRWTGESKIASWRTPDLIWFSDELSDDADIDGDFLNFRGGAPAISAKAYKVLQPLLENSVEFLPVTIQGETRQLINVTNVLPLMDIAKSTFKIYNDGKIGPCQHAHLNDPDPKELIFMVNGYFPRIFINDELKKRIEEAGLTGVLIREYLNPAAK